MITPDEQELLRSCFDSLHGALTIIERIVEDYGDLEAKRLFTGAQHDAIKSIDKLRQKFDVPFYPKKEGSK